MPQPHSTDSASDDGISVIEIGEIEGGGGSVFAGLLDAYQGQGYEQGYRRALADVRASLLFLTEQYLWEIPPNDADPRKLLYDFEAHIECHLLRVKSEEFVSGGLGI